MKTCPICRAKAVASARTCYECYYRFSDRSTRDVKEGDIQTKGAGLGKGFERTRLAEASTRST